MSSRLQKKSSPGFVHDGLPIFAWKHALAPQTRACLRHVIVNNVLVNADTWQASACHCEPRPRTRARLPAFSMSLQASVFRSRTRSRLQHVIANQCAHWCGNPFSQQGNLASWQYLWQIRSSCVFAGNSCFSFCPAAGDADCHVASLLAMTVGGGPCTR